jgi:streptogramin lyase
VRHFKITVSALLLFAMVLLIVLAPGAFSQDMAGRIRGSVTSVDGKPMEGVTVSVRGQGEPYVTTVFTNEHGIYNFPQLGKNARHSLWAQAQGFETAKSDAVPGKEVPALHLKPLKDFSKQLTGVEWMNSFPENTPQEKREKQIFVSNCSGCHSNHFALQNRFDADGWSKIITVMSKDSEGTQMNRDVVGETSMNEYKDELVAFLTKVRGPAPANYTLKPLPRPTGEAAQVVITEYDVPRPEAPAEALLHNGSDWMEGTPSRWEGRASHDAAVGSDGHVYFSDDRSMTSTMNELDPKTGKVTLLAYPYENGVAPTHGVTSDADGNIWADSMGDFLNFDPKTQKFKDFPRPAGMKATVGGTVAGDELAYKGVIWGTAGDGAMKLDTKTGQYTSYEMPDSHKGTYGITVDRHGNAWYTSPGGDRVYMVDAETGKTSDIIFEPLGPETGMAVTEKDKEAYANIRANQNSANPLQNCPRRIGADPNADVVWVALFCADKIARIDTKTRDVTEYSLPHKYSRPYGVFVDNEHNVWVNMLNTDMIARYNPTTKTFTEFQMPSRGTDIRHMAFDYTSTPMTIYLPYNRSNKVARIQFRKASDME